MTLPLIKTKKDYQNALVRLEKIFDANPGSSEGDELEVLGVLIDVYEKEYYPIDFHNALLLGEKSGMQKDFDPKKNLKKFHSRFL